MTSTRDTTSHDSSDEAFDQLRAADPAAGSDPDTTALRAAVAAGVAASGGAEVFAGADGVPSDGTSGATTLAPVVDLAARRPRVRWVQVAAIAAGAIMVGGGGYAIGSSGDSFGPEVLAVGAQEPATMTLPGVAADESTGSALGAPPQVNKAISPYFSSRTVFTSLGLDDVGGTAHAWGFDAASVFSADTAATIAKAFGLDGTPAVNYGSWRVGSEDWTGPSLDLQPDAQTSFFYSNPVIDAWSEDSAVRSVDEATAIAALSAVMSAVGIDPALFTFSTQAYEGSRETSVTATPAVDGAPAPVTWQASVTSEGILSASGYIAPLIDLGAYDVIGAESAVRRLSDPRFGATGDFFIPAASDMMRKEPEASAADGSAGLDPADATSTAGPAEPNVVDPSVIATVPPQATSGTVFSWPVASVTITGATLTTTLLMSADGSSSLVPAYRLTSSDGSAWTVIAVSDAHLNFDVTD